MRVHARTGHPARLLRHDPALAPPEARPTGEATRARPVTAVPSKPQFLWRGLAGSHEEGSPHLASLPQGWQWAMPATLSTVPATGVARGVLEAPLGAEEPTCQGPRGNCTGASGSLDPQSDHLGVQKTRSLQTRFREASTCPWQPWRLPSCSVGDDTQHASSTPRASALSGGQDTRRDH